MLETFDTIYYTSLFLLGGYISQQTVENAYPSGDDTPSEKMLLRYLFFSLVIFTMSYPAILFLTSEFSETTKLEELLLSLIPLCIASIIVGLARRKYVRYIMERGRSIIPLFSAWDRAFYSLTKAYLKVKLKSGSEIFGCIDSSAYNPTEEEMNQTYGFLYTMSVIAESGLNKITKVYLFHEATLST